MFKFIKVTGSSLSPFYFAGDYVLIWRGQKRLRKLSPGDYVVFTHEEYGLLIKRVIHNDSTDQFIEAEGNYPDSLSTQEIGKIPYEKVVGKVIRRFSDSP